MIRSIAPWMPLVMSTLNLATAVGYLLTKDYWRAFYWLCATGLTFSTMFMR